MVRRSFFILAVVGLLVPLALAQRWPDAIWLLAVTGPLIALGLFDVLQKRHTVLRIYPVIGHLRYLFEAIRPELQQYFVESDIDGRPVSREFRSLVYQRSKNARDTRPFGTIFDVYRDGAEWMNHSLNPTAAASEPPRVTFGAERCDKPYDASCLNISAMSFGALSKHAILALNKGASAGNFAHNTGEGGLSPYHLAGGGDLIWQIGTAYFGCRTADGQFDPAKFEERAAHPKVRMIEVKLSQGAKPGHGGILPAGKLTEEIARIRLVPMGQDVISPAAHSAFSNPIELLEFVTRLRDLSGGKPVGFKLCIGERAEFLSIGKAMLESGLLPDFITIDGSEGGTGAAPIELTNSVGTPLREGLALAHNMLVGLGVRSQIRLIASGKAFSAFHIARTLALGADTVNVARAMMFAVGCIQSRLCNTNHCPTGVATQDPNRYRQLDVDDKARRVAHYHANTMKALAELLASAGLEHPGQLRREDIYRRIDGQSIKTYREIFPPVDDGCLLPGNEVPAEWDQDWERANASQWPSRM